MEAPDGYVILEFPFDARPLAYSAGKYWLSDFYSEQDSWVRRYQDTFADLASMALNEEDSRRFLMAMSRGLPL